MTDTKPSYHRYTMQNDSFSFLVFPKFTCEIREFSQQQQQWQRWNTYNSNRKYQFFLSLFSYTRPHHTVFLLFEWIKWTVDTGRHKHNTPHVDTSDSFDGLPTSVRARYPFNNCLNCIIVNAIYMNIDETHSHTHALGVHDADLFVFGQNAPAATSFECSCANTTK